MGGKGPFGIDVTSDALSGSQTLVYGGDAESGARNGGFDPHLQQIIAAWPKLSPALQQAIITLIEATSPH